MAHLLNAQAMWDFQHALSCVARGHSSQHMQQWETMSHNQLGQVDIIFLKNQVREIRITLFFIILENNIYLE
jgi:hypothetical protein